MATTKYFNNGRLVATVSTDPEPEFFCAHIYDGEDRKMVSGNGLSVRSSAKPGGRYPNAKRWAIWYGNYYQLGQIDGGAFGDTRIITERAESVEQARARCEFFVENIIAAFVPAWDERSTIGE